MNRPLLILVALIGCPALTGGARIVSLVPSHTEIVEALGGGDEIVGVTIFERDTAAARGRTLIGDFMNPSLETIVSLKPDLILAGGSEHSRVVPRLRQMGFRVAEIRNPPTLEALYGTIDEIARTIGRPGAAAPVVERMRRDLAALQSGAPHPPVRGYVEIDAPLWTIGGADWLSEALALAGLENIFADLGRAAGQVSSEAVVRRDPEVIVSLRSSAREMARRPGWSAIRAVRDGRVFDEVSPDRLSRPSPRLVEGLGALAERIRAARVEGQR